MNNSQQDRRPELQMVQGRLSDTDALVVGSIFAWAVLHCQERQPAEGCWGMGPAGCCRLLQKRGRFVVRHNRKVKRPF